jgi:hypothetical protein
LACIRRGSRRAPPGPGGFAIGLRYALALAVVSLPLVGAAHAPSLSEELDEIHGLDAAIAGSGDAARARELAGHCARLKQAAIEHAIVAYGIDVSAVPSGVHYSPHGAMRDREGVTLVDRDGTLRVLVGDLAFGSAGWLGSTIAHEVEVHVNRQIAKGAQARAGDEQGQSIDEVEAYDFELAGQARFGLGGDEQRLVRQRRAAFYRALKDPNRKRVDAGVYAKAGGTSF